MGYLPAFRFATCGSASSSASATYADMVAATWALAGQRTAAGRGVLAATGSRSLPPRAPARAHLCRTLRLRLAGTG
eukprot:scaffold7480_cov430-Prasinococcus_capsulatus_cf.AAC.2